MKKLISVLLVVVLAVGLFAGSAWAASGDASGNFSDFRYFYSTSVGPGGSIASFSGSPGYYQVTAGSSSTSYGYMFTVVFILPSELSDDGAISVQSFPFGFSSSAETSSWSYVSFATFDSDGVVITGSSGSLFSPFSFPLNLPVVAGSRFIRVSAFKSSSYSATPQFSNILYSNFVYSSSDTGYDPSLDQNILDGLFAIAQSLLAFEAGPYSVVDRMGVDSQGNVYWGSSSLDLIDYLNHVGEASGFSQLFLYSLNDNFGSFYSYHSVVDPNTGTIQVVRNFPSYVNLLGLELTDGINRLQRDNLLIYQQGEDILDSISDLETTLSNDINDALYADTDDTPAESWSVARWLKGIYDSVTGFFASFWSPAETAIKDSNEDAMEAVTTNGIHTTVQNVNDAASMQSAITGLLPAGDINGFAPLQDTAFHSFWSEETHEAMLPPPVESESTSSNSRRLLSSSPPSSSAPVVDYSAYDRNQALARSLLGGD